MRQALRAFAMVAGVIAVATMSKYVRASDNRALDADIISVAEEWAKIKYLSDDDSDRSSKMAVLAPKTDALVKRYPGRPEPLIWDGIVVSEQASLSSGFTALNFAGRARDLLLEAYKIDPKALDAGAPTSLGVLYYRVPGFPLAWGDKEKARRYLEEAIKNAPNGRDAHYFYADFLYEQHDYKRAEEMLKVGMALLKHPERPVWDQYFPMVMETLLDRIEKKLKP
ncbi:tetratricopeptide repeat protein [Bradyrhizobium sp. CCGUVB14]|uniref:tetratricopeptide repeat protein n=1 Tax=Bradyrhizobium sp. CCGUVB14 TaxID=2949628 RepID=UPI0020B28752|nr:tetratricopeptide repeat protein [Bradyrhizobium sp. CCGUVB14]MCP3446064.1 tetratricopeptide repeat protein [Bradyrhizobium sp. CCGUVB14]